MGRSVAEMENDAKAHLIDPSAHVAHNSKNRIQADELRRILQRRSPRANREHSLRHPLSAPSSHERASPLTLLKNLTNRSNKSSPSMLQS